MRGAGRYAEDALDERELLLLDLLQLAAGLQVGLFEEHGHAGLELADLGGLRGHLLVLPGGPGLEVVEAVGDNRDHPRPVSGRACGGLVPLRVRVVVEDLGPEALGDAGRPGRGILCDAALDRVVKVCLQQRGWGEQGAGGGVP